MEKEIKAFIAIDPQEGGIIRALQVAETEADIKREIPYPIKVGFAVIVPCTIKYEVPTPPVGELLGNEGKEITN